MCPSRKPALEDIQAGNTALSCHHSRWIEVGPSLDGSRIAVAMHRCYRLLLYPGRWATYVLPDVAFYAAVPPRACFLYIRIQTFSKSTVLSQSCNPIWCVQEQVLTDRQGRFPSQRVLERRLASKQHLSP